VITIRECSAATEPAETVIDSFSGLGTGAKIPIHVSCRQQCVVLERIHHGQQGFIVRPETVRTRTLLAQGCRVCDGATCDGFVDELRK
jgi:hypothetical protein